MLQDDDDEIVDVVTLKANMVYCSSDEEDDGSSYVTDLTAKNGPLWFLPISPEVENPEENPLSLLYGKLLLEALLTGDVTLTTGYKMFLF